MKALIFGLVLAATAVSCPVKTPGPGPSPTPTLAPTPGPTDNPALATPQHITWVNQLPPPPARFTGVLNEIILAEFPQCDHVNSDCPTGLSQQAFFDRIMPKLRLKGYWAGQHEDGITDAISIGTAQFENQTYHAYNSGGGKVVWDSYRDTWHAVETPPITGPGPDCKFDGCNTTCCPGGGPVCTSTTLYCGPGPVIPISCPPLTDLKLKTHQNNPGSIIVDATPRGPDCARCASINKGCDNGVCPLGPEGTPEFDAQRIACETAAGPYVFTFNGQKCDAQDVPCFHQGDNPLSVKVLAPGLVEVRAGNGVGNQVQVNP